MADDFMIQTPEDGMRLLRTMQRRRMRHDFGDRASRRPWRPVKRSRRWEQPDGVDLGLPDDLDLPWILPDQMPAFTPHAPSLLGDRPRYYWPDGTPIPATPEDPTGCFAWASASTAARIVARSTRFRRGVRVTVSTIWIGIDHAFGHRPPLIFETMIFYAGRGERSFGRGLECWRYTTREAALNGHRQILATIAANRTATRRYSC